jgi:mannose-6-phosphate isomerase
MLIEKPWGSEELLEKNERYVLKKLFMKEGHKCSIQYHNFKHETIYVLSGKLKIYYGENINELNQKLLGPGGTVVLLPKEIHRMEAVEDCYYLEASTPELDDVVRLVDSYGRV